MVTIFQGLVPLFITLVIIVVIIYMSYLCSKYMAVGANRIHKASYMKLIDKMLIGQEKWLAIVKIADKYFLISVTTASIELLTELQEADIVELPDQKQGVDSLTESFHEVFSKIASRKKK